MARYKDSFYKLFACSFEVVNELDIHSGFVGMREITGM
jgi:hypothetical protein